ncbi:MAG: hypothetical protein KDA65_09480 [Planctomycetaceae bacterium]|nr:hypothetical protein [Planctomycetaceae bacterium]
MNLEPLPPNRLRMLNVFKKQYRETDNKKALFEKWTHYFTESILNKKQFNRYDNESAEDERESDTGKGWTSQLLENSRLNKRAQYIATNVKECDFCLAAHELSLGISSMKNHLQAKRSDQIKPDGLAVRKNGFFSVFEIKAFNDIQKIDEALLQAICGALAIYAKRSMIVAIARSDNGPFRPAIKNARIPKLKPSLGVHLLMAADDKGDPIKGWSKKIELLSAEILENFKQLEYIAFSFLNRKQAKDIRTITISYLITRDGIKRL